MTISLRIRRDLVITDPDRFLAAARAAYRDLNPGSSETEAAEAVTDVYDGMFALLDRAWHLLATTTGPPATQILPDPRQPELGRSALPSGSRITDRPDGLSPAGWLQHIVLSESQPLQDFGCFLPRDPFALPADHSDHDS